jgi:hypothetical protein
VNAEEIAGHLSIAKALWSEIPRLRAETCLVNVRDTVDRE